MIRITLIDQTEEAKCGLCGGVQRPKDKQVVELNREGKRLYLCGVCFAEILDFMAERFRQRQAQPQAAGLH